MMGEDMFPPQSICYASVWGLLQPLRRKEGHPDDTLVVGLQARKICELYNKLIQKFLEICLT